VLLVNIPGTNERVESSAGASLSRAVSAGCPAGGINDAYRSYAEQVTMFLSRYRVQWSGRGLYGDVRRWNGKRYVRTSGAGMAARPGTSTHGDGLALDLARPQRTWMFAHGAAYGWFNTIKSEPWHWEYSARNDTHKGDDMSAGEFWGYKNPAVTNQDAYTHLRRASGNTDAILAAVKALGTPTINVPALAAEIAKLIPAPTVDYAKLANATADAIEARERARWAK